MGRLFNFKKLFIYKPDSVPPQYISDLGFRYIPKSDISNPKYTEGCLSFIYFRRHRRNESAYPPRCTSSTVTLPK